MTSKGYKHSEETKRKMSEARRGRNNPRYGKKHTEESKNLMSENRKGKNAGPDNHNYGKTFSAETRKKMSDAMKGRFTGKDSPHYGKPKSPEHRKKLSEAAKNRPPISEETRIKKSEAWKGDKNPNYGKPLADETKRKLSDGMIGRFPGEKNPFYGKKHSDEALSIMREKKTGENHPMYGITRSEEVRRKISEGKMGGKNPSWKGGTSKRRYGFGFSDRLKREIRERDGYICQWCKGPGKHIHHIDGNVKNNEPWNLITLCIGCNTKEQHRNYREEMMPIFYEITRSTISNIL